jgi:lactoylglutathione lyase
MATFEGLTPNLIASDIDRSLAFYRDVLGFSVFLTQPQSAPFVFVWLQHGPVNVFLNTLDAAKAEYPAFSTVRPGSWTMFIATDDVDALHAQIAGQVKTVMPLETKFYGMREFAIEDPDGYVITFAQRV